MLTNPAGLMAHVHSVCVCVCVCVCVSKEMLFFAQSRDSQLSLRVRGMGEVVIEAPH